MPAKTRDLNSRRGTIGSSSLASATTNAASARTPTMSAPNTVGSDQVRVDASRSA